MLRSLQLFLESITGAVKFTGRPNVTFEKLEIILKTAKKKKNYSVSKTQIPLNTSV